MEKDKGPLVQARDVSGPPSEGTTAERERQCNADLASVAVQGDKILVCARRARRGTPGEHSKEGRL